MHADGRPCSHEWTRSARLHVWIAMVVLPIVAGLTANAAWGTIPLGPLPLAFPWAGALVVALGFGIAYVARPRSLR